MTESTLAISSRSNRVLLRAEAVYDDGDVGDDCDEWTGRSFLPAGRRRGSDDDNDEIVESTVVELLSLSLSLLLLMVFHLNIESLSEEESTISVLMSDRIPSSSSLTFISETDSISIEEDDVDGL